jgi:hypothetical protein
MEEQDKFLYHLLLLEEVEAELQRMVQQSTSCRSRRKWFSISNIRIINCKSWRRRRIS